jgi:hypothetical protein
LGLYGYDSGVFEMAKSKVTDLAAAIIQKATSDEQAAAEQRARDLATYVQLVKEAAATPESGRVGQGWSNLLTASRIVGNQVGHDADGDVGALDAIRVANELTATHGDLLAAVAKLNAEFAGFAALEQQLLEAQQRQRYEQKQQFEQRGRLQQQLSSAAAAACAARQSIGHLGLEG